MLPEKPENESLGVDIVALYFRNDKGEVISTPMTGEPAYLCVECRSHQRVKNANLGIIIKALAGEHERVLYITSASDNEYLNISSKKVEIQMQMPCCGLLPGVYSAKIYLREGVRSLDIVESFRFTVDAKRNTSKCLYYQPRTWVAIDTTSKDTAIRNSTNLIHAKVTSEDQENEQPFT